MFGGFKMKAIGNSLLAIFIVRDLLIHYCRCSPQPPDSFSGHTPSPSRSLHQSRRVLQYPSHARHCHVWLPKKEHRPISARKLRSFLLPWRCATNFCWSPRSCGDIKTYYRLSGRTICTIYCPSSPWTFQCHCFTSI